MHPPYPRAEMQRRVLDAVARGQALHELERQPGFPSRQTIFRWAKGDPAFAARLTEARALRTAGRAEAREAPSFNEAVAEAMLLRVRRGEAIRDLVRDPAMPGREQLNRWKRERPEFAAALDAAWRFSAGLGKRKRWTRYVEAAADEIILRLSKGEAVPAVLADPALPGKAAVARWKRLRPDFAAAFEVAKVAGHRARMTRRRKLTPELREAIVGAVTRGRSLLAVSKLPGMPHNVTLHGWMRDDPAFAGLVRFAAQERDVELAFREYDLALSVAARARDLPPPEQRAVVRQARREAGVANKRIGRMARKGRP